MKQAYILNMAMNTLMNRMAIEEEKLSKNPNNTIAKTRLDRYENEYKELNNMIIDAEKQA